jgi:cardiolipin synthase
VDVRIIVPHIPDNWYVFAVTRSFYRQLMASGVRINEYTPGFIHAKCDRQ